MRGALAPPHCTLSCNRPAPAAALHPPVGHVRLHVLHIQCRRVATPQQLVDFAGGEEAEPGGRDDLSGREVVGGRGEAEGVVADGDKGDAVS